MFVVIPKGFLPTQDTGLIMGLSQAGQDVSPEKLKRLHIALTRLIERDPDVATVGSAFGSGNGTTPNTGRFFISLKPHDQPNASVTQVIDRLRPQLANVEGVVLFLQPLQDHRGRRPCRARAIPVHPPGRRHRRVEQLGPTPSRQAQDIA